MLVMDTSGWARSPRTVALISAALIMSLLLATAFLLVDHFRPSTGVLDHPAQPLSDRQAMAQVVEPAKEIVAIAQLKGSTGGYLLESCRDLQHPPYQGAVYMTFDLPTADTGDALVYLQKMAGTLVADGWTEGLPPNQHQFGHTLTRNGITAIVYRDPDQPKVAAMQVYGECRNTTDHAADPTGWTDITPLLNTA
jgi:hypothetical protein